MQRPSRRALAIALALGALATAACRREEPQHYRVAKAPGSEAPALGAAPVPAAARPAPPGMQGDVPPPPTPAAGLKWTLPKGWEQTMSGGIRYATLKPPGAGKVDISVVVLPGPAGGEMANVNRWRGQIGLPAIDEKALDAARKTVKSKAGSIALFDFTSDGQAKSRMVTGLLTGSDGNTWFVKMVGDEAPVAAARADLVRLLETLRFD